MRGFVEYIRPESIEGWAWDDRSAAAPKVRVRLADHVIATGDASLERRDVARKLGDEKAIGSGFLIQGKFVPKDADNIVVQASHDGSEWVDLPKAKRPSASSKSYQDFDGTGASKSREKLAALKLDELLVGKGSAPLAGKSVLDIGCNEGYFCAEAIRQGASRTLGIDASEQWIEKAKVRVPQAEFRTSSWWEIPDEKFDVIFFLSAIHYEPEPRKLFRKLVNHLTDDGVLILECGVKGRGTKSWNVVDRWDGPKRYPTLELLCDDLLKDYGVRFVGKSVSQDGDSVPRYVFHCRPRHPVAMVVAGRSKAGKTMLARSLQGQGITVYDSDSVILKLITHSDYMRLPLAKELVDEFGETETNFGKIENFIAKDNRRTDLFCDLVAKEVPTEADLFCIEGEIFIHETVKAGLLSKLGELGVHIWFVQRGN